jgi:hypothetical protein
MFVIYRFLTHDFCFAACMDLKILLCQMWDLLVEYDMTAALDQSVLGPHPPCIFRVIIKFASLLWPAHDLVLKGYGRGGIRSTLLERVAETIVRHV